MALNNNDETQSCRPSICCYGHEGLDDREPEERRRGKPNGAAAAKQKQEGGGGCSECLYLYNICNDHSNSNNGNGCNCNNSKRRRRDSFSNLRRRDIPARAENNGNSSSGSAKEDGSGRSYLPTLKEAKKRAELVHSLKQQICKLEKELATKIKEEKEKAASFPNFTFTLL